APIKAAINIVDRKEGGSGNLHRAGIEIIRSIYQVDVSILEKAIEKGILDNEQLELARAYQTNPTETMRDFLLQNRDFLKESLLSPDPKIAKRARKLIQNNLYNLP